MIHENQQVQARREETGAKGHKPCGKTLVNRAYDGGDVDGAVSQLMSSTGPMRTLAALVGRRAPCVGSNSGTERSNPALPSGLGPWGGILRPMLHAQYR